MKSVWWEGGAVRLLDQTRLPHETVVRTCRTWREVADAIRRLQIRGAPAIGVAAAYGLALAAHEAGSGTTPLPRLRDIANSLGATRPTAVNLRWALTRMLAAAERVQNAAGIPEALRIEAEAIADGETRASALIAEHGVTLIHSGERILTYCNTGSLATVGVGTAYGILRRAHELGKGIHVIACETRPVLQGARLTAWELCRDGIPFTLITDNAAGSLMARGLVDRVVVGADRIARNGDVANKIGTYTLAVLARAHEIPFIVAAPTSTVDMHLADGSGILIEERAPDEVVRIGQHSIAPDGIRVSNPAFDVTPSQLVSAIVTDRGIATPPFGFTPETMAVPAARR